jgi:hypothetical protein
MRVAYADPPYPGQSKKHYGDHEDYAGEVDHSELIARLVDEFPDGWALSTSATALRFILPMCPDDVRISPWVKPFAVIKKNVRVTYAWEPVIWRGGRKDTRRAGAAVDWVSANIVLRNHNGTRGSKPEEFCFWIFDVLNLEQDDELVDLFPGSGAVTDAWERWRTQTRLPMTLPSANRDMAAAKLQMALDVEATA